MANQAIGSRHRDLARLAKMSGGPYTDCFADQRQETSDDERSRRRLREPDNDRARREPERHPPSRQRVGERSHESVRHFGRRSSTSGRRVHDKSYESLSAWLERAASAEVRYITATRRG